jgi:hypothetical protein
MKRLTAALLSVLLLTACGSSSSTSTTPTAAPTESETVQQPVAFEELQAALDYSLGQLAAVGTVSIYSNDSKPFFTEIYDPNSAFDYKGVGWMIKSDQVELLLDLNMFSLYRLQAALDSAEPLLVEKLDIGKYRFTPTDSNLGAEITVTLDVAGLVTDIEFPEDENPDSVKVQYGLDSFMLDLIERANIELIG